MLWGITEEWGQLLRGQRQPEPNEDMEEAMAAEWQAMMDGLKSEADARAQNASTGPTAPRKTQAGDHIPDMGVMDDEYVAWVRPHYYIIHICCTASYVLHR